MVFPPGLFVRGRRIRLSPPVLRDRLEGREEGRKDARKDV